MKITISGEEINNSKIYRLTQQGELFTNRFKLGSTLCRVVEMDVDKTEFSAPYMSFNKDAIVRIYDDDDNVQMTLFMDSVEDNNERYYTITLTDQMVRLAKPFYWEDTDTVQTIINKICDSFYCFEYPTIEYMGDLVVNWGSGTSAREFISYVAEVNGSFAYIDNEGRLRFRKLRNNYGPDYLITKDDCSSLKIGTHHHIGRVLVELAANTHAYPEEFIGGNETIYLNPENILLTDNDERYTIQKVVEHIFEEYRAFDWYDLTVEKANLPQKLVPGDHIAIADEDSAYATFVQISNWTYNGKWIGGLSLDLNDEQQQESYVSPDSGIKRIQIRVDRDLNQVIQKVEDVDKSVTEVIQDAQGITGIFSNYEGVKYIDVNTDGITISSGEENTTQLNMDYDGVTITNEGKDVAQMKENTFRTSEWVLQQTRDNSVFNIFRR